MSTGTRHMLKLEVLNSQTPIEDKPGWMKNVAHIGKNYSEMQDLARAKGLHTVCEAARCPNLYECWQDREATFLIGGDICTRRCDFCNIATGRPALLDVQEPRKVAESVRDLGLRYATVTCVSRDDLPDGGAWLNAETVRAIHTINPTTGVEILVGDFKCNPDSVQQVIDAKPEVFAHNLETVPRIFRQIRPAFSYEGSLNVLTQAKEGGMIVKSNLILGMGETDDEIYAAMCDLYDSGCDILTLTQYLRPSPLFHPVERWVKPKQFVEFAKQATEIGFLGVMAGPMVRSSYRAGWLWARAMTKARREIPANLAHIADSGSALQEASSVMQRGDFDTEELVASTSTYEGGCCGGSGTASGGCCGGTKPQDSQTKAMVG